MQGRLENEMRIQQSTDELMKEMPDYMQEWYINMKASRRTASSCQDYARKIRKFLLYIHDNPKEITPDMITLQACESYMIACQTKTNEEGMIVYTSDSYQQGVWCALNSFMKYLQKRNYITHNYIMDIEKPKNKDLDRINQDRILLTQKDFQKILKSAKSGSEFMNGVFNNRDILIILLFMTTGMRKTAMSDINIEDVDIEKKTLTVIDKGNKIHTYVLNEQVMFYLNGWLQDRVKLLTNNTTNALFVNRYGDRMKGPAIYDIVVKHCNNALGKKLSPHKLRSGFCSILYNKTHDIEFVRRVVGHSSIITTQRYIKTEEKEKEKATQIMGDILNI